jgi:hypothetical protein
MRPSALAPACLAVLACVSLAHGQLPAPTSKPKQRKLFTASSSTEATLKYEHAVEFLGSGTPEEAQEAAESQAQFLFGALFLGHSAKPLGAPKQVADIKLKGAPKKVGEDRWVASYSYKGVIQLGLTGTDQGSLQFPLPRSPDEVWSQAQKANPGATTPCGDGLSDHEGSGFLWYVWNPRYHACKLEAGKHYDWVKGTYERPTTPPQKTYPEYANLVRKGPGGKKSIRIDMLMGVASEPQITPADLGPDQRFRFDPFKPGNKAYGDVTSSSYRQIVSAFKQGLGISGVQFSARKWSDAEVDKLAVGEEKSRLIPYVADYTYVVPAGAPQAGTEITVRMYEGVTTAGSEGSETFYGFLKDSFERGSVMMYSGHSSLGRGLNLEVIEGMMGVKLQPDCKSYQIFFFNGCSSYGYYNRDYFRRKIGCGGPADKEGTEKLDVLTNGLETYFIDMPKGDLTLIRAIVYWALGKGSPTYQAIAKEVDSNNLFGVNGDTDPGNLKP